LLRLGKTLFHHRLDNELLNIFSQENEGRGRVNFQNQGKVKTKGKRMKFSTKLCSIIEKEELSSVIFWCLNDNAFAIHKRSFEKVIIPQYFQTSRLKSIEKQFNICRFNRVKDIGGGFVMHEHQHFK